MTVKIKDLYGDYTGNKFNSFGAYSAELKLGKNNVLNENTQVNDDKNDNYNQHLVESKIHERALFNRKQEIYDILLERYVEKAFNKIYIDSLPLDESFLIPNKKAILSNFKTRFKQELQCENLVEGIQASQNEICLLILEACKEKATKKSKKIVEENDIEDKDQVVLGILSTDDEDNDDIALKDDLSSDDISSLVKDKVIQVMSDEEDSNQKNKQLVDDIVSSTNLGESVNIFKKDIVENYTLFKSISIGNYKRVLNETKESNESSMYATLSESGEIKVNLDLTLCDSLLEYTILELTNTINLVKYNAKSVRELAENYAYSYK